MLSLILKYNIIYIMKLKREIEMLKFEMKDLREFSEDDLVKMIGWDISDWFEGEVYKSGVYNIEFGCRGEIEDVSKVEVKDGVFEVESREELLDSCKDEEEREEMEDWVYVEMNNGVVEVCEFEEFGYDYYRVEVEIDEEDVFENGELIIEDVSSDVDDDSGVLVYSYNGKYVVMNFDYGGSLCECDVYSSLDEVKEMM